MPMRRSGGRKDRGDFRQVGSPCEQCRTAIRKAFVETTLEEMDRVLDIKRRGVFAATQAALKHMGKGGRIIMIGSAVGERAVLPGLCPTRPRREPSRCSLSAFQRGRSRGITVTRPAGVRSTRI